MTTRLSVWGKHYHTTPIMHNNNNMLLCTVPCLYNKCCTEDIQRVPKKCPSQVIIIGENWVYWVRHPEGIDCNKCDKINRSKKVFTNHTDSTHFEIKGKIRIPEPELSKVEKPNSRILLSASLLQTHSSHKYVEMCE